MNKERKAVTINIKKEDHFNGGLNFKSGEILQMKNFPLSSGKRYNLIMADPDYTVGNHSAKLTLRGLNISKWWLIRKIQLKVLQIVFKSSSK